MSELKIDKYFGPSKDNQNVSVTPLQKLPPDPNTTDSSPNSPRMDTSQDSQSQARSQSQSYPVNDSQTPTTALAASTPKKRNLTPSSSPLSGIDKKQRSIVQVAESLGKKVRDNMHYVPTEPLFNEEVQANRPPTPTTPTEPVFHTTSPPPPHLQGISELLQNTAAEFEEELMKPISSEQILTPEALREQIRIFNENQHIQKSNARKTQSLVLRMHEHHQENLKTSEGILAGLYFLR